MRRYVRPDGYLLYVAPLRSITPDNLILDVYTLLPLIRSKLQSCNQAKRFLGQKARPTRLARGKMASNLYDRREERTEAEFMSKKLLL